jgi:hypothetical protein
VGLALAAAAGALLLDLAFGGPGLLPGPPSEWPARVEQWLTTTRDADRYTPPSRP